MPQCACCEAEDAVLSQGSEGLMMCDDCRDVTDFIIPESFVHWLEYDCDECKCRAYRAGVHFDRSCTGLIYCSSMTKTGWRRRRVRYKDTRTVKR